MRIEDFDDRGFVLETIERLLDAKDLPMDSRERLERIRALIRSRDARSEPG